MYCIYILYCRGRRWGQLSDPVGYNVFLCAQPHEGKPILYTAHATNSEIRLRIEWWIGETDNVGLLKTVRIRKLRLLAHGQNIPAGSVKGQGTGCTSE